MSEEVRDPQQVLRVDGVLAEGVVEACALHAKLLGEPRNGAPLPFQLFMDALPDSQVVDGQFQPFAPIQVLDKRSCHRLSGIGAGKIRFL